jgi:hypothetical protein
LRQIESVGRKRGRERGGKKGKSFYARREENRIKKKIKDREQK